MSSGPARGAPPPKQHGLTSFPVPSAEEDMQHDEVDEEVHKDEDVSIKVGALRWARELAPRRRWRNCPGSDAGCWCVVASL